MHPKTGQKMTRRNVNRNKTPATNQVQNARTRASSTNASEERNANHTGHRDQESSDRNQYAPGKITITFKKPPNMYRRKGVVTSNANLICKPTTGGQVQRKEPDNPKKRNHNNHTQQNRAVLAGVPCSNWSEPREAKYVQPNP